MAFFGAVLNTVGALFLTHAYVETSHLVQRLEMALL
jgi:hypothetical protein